MKKLMMIALSAALLAGCDSPEQPIAPQKG